MKKSILTVAAALLLCFAFVLGAGCGGGAADSQTATITYITGTDADIPSTTAKVGSKIYPPAEPSREGYRFGGWLDENGIAFVFDTMPAGGAVLTADWNKIYTVTFETGAGATAVEPAEYTEGETVALPEAPTRAHYKFTGWYLDGQPFAFGAMPARDITLTAQWTEASTITFETGVDGLSVAPIVEPAGTQIDAPAAPYREGYHLMYWALGGKKYDFSVMPAEDVTLTAVWEEMTNLPAMFIDLFDANGNTVDISAVTREQYVQSTISLDNTEMRYRLDSVPAQFKGRGNGSWTESGNKKGYRIKFDSKQSLFGEESSKHWVIIACTNFNDTTMSRNYLAYNMAKEVFGGIEYATSARWIDVYVNGNYHGVYLLCEHVRVDEGRVDIDSQYGVRDTGYLIEYDCYASGTEGIDYFTIPDARYAFTVHSPDPEEYQTDGGISQAQYMQQVAYIKAYVQEVYSAAIAGNFTKFSELADAESFIDMYILHELFKNADTGYSSFYMYKKPGGKLYAGPPWDFDCSTTATRGDTSPEGIYVGNSVADTSSHTASELYISLMQKSRAFREAVATRWKELFPAIRTFLDEKLNDAVYEANTEAMGKNFVKWPPAGWPAGLSQTAAGERWVTDTKALKQWLSDRCDWLDREWK